MRRGGERGKGCLQKERNSKDFMPQGNPIDVIFAGFTFPSNWGCWVGTPFCSGKLVNERGGGCQFLGGVKKLRTGGRKVENK